MCLLKKTNTSFNWVVLVFKITQGGGGGGRGACTQAKILCWLSCCGLLGSPGQQGAVRTPLRGTAVPVGRSGRPRQATRVTLVRGAGRLGVALPLTL